MFSAAPPLHSASAEAATVIRMITADVVYHIRQWMSRAIEDAFKVLEGGQGEDGRWKLEQTYRGKT